MSNDECNRVQLKEHLETRMAEMEERFALRMRASDEALRLARQELERRLDELNKLRSEVTADRGQFVLVLAYNLWRDIVENRLTKIETKSTTRGEVIAFGIVLAGLIVGILKLLK